MARAKQIGAIHVELGANDPTTTAQNTQINKTASGYVTYGEDNNQFNYLLWLYLESPTQGSILNALNRMVFGEGLNDPTAIDDNELRKLIGDYNIFQNYSAQLVDKKPFHISVNYLRALEVDEEGKIPGFGYSTDWSDNAVPIKELENWDLNPNAKLSVYYGRPFVPNAFYYSPPIYNSGMQYMEQEISIKKYQLKHTNKGFSAGTLINWNNGIPTEEARKEQVRQINNKLTGDGDVIINAFNEDETRAVTITNLEISNAVDKYTYASEEAARQIMKVNGISSPVILGLPTANGFSSSADELREAKIRFINDKVKPIQDFIAYGLNQMLGREDLEFVNETAAEGDKVIEDEEVSEEDTELSEVNTDLQEFISLGSDELEGFELFSSTEVDYDGEDELDDIIATHFQTNMSKVVNFVSTGKASPRTKSKQDTEDYAVRYRYTRGGKANDADSKDRDFCLAMDSANKLYRKEDILAMRNKPVNPGFGEKGKNTYPIWLYKGGARCRHKWFREVYLKKETSDKSRVALGKKVSVAEARRNGAKIETNDPKVSIVPDNMKHKGYVTKATMPQDAKNQTSGI